MADTAPAVRNNSARFKTVAEKIQDEVGLVSTDQDSLDEFIKGNLANIGEADDFATINNLMETASLPASKDLVGRTFTILDFVLRPSTKEGGRIKTFAIIKSVDENGEEFIFEGGGDNFIVGLTRMRDLYDFPFMGTITGRPVGEGNTLIGWRFMDPKRAKIQ